MIKDKSKKSVDNIGKQLLLNLGISLCVDIIHEIYDIGKSLNVATIDIPEWDDSYEIINKMIYELSPVMYSKHRTPTSNKQYYDLNNGTSYFIPLKNGNYIKVETYRNSKENKLYSEKRIKLHFIGKEKFKNRESFIKTALRMRDDKFIKVKYLNDTEINCDIIPHSFDNVILDKKSKDNIIDGLINWKNSKDWYDGHQLVHKIGVFLYGQPGTGKSTIVKAISHMFDNAIILSINPENIMNSINWILNTRKKTDETIIVLIEDFDMYFKSREEIENVEMDIDAKKRKDFNQNAIFQLLDGVYSTSNTIYIATTNYKDRIDPALIRYGRFDIQEEVRYFDKEKALEFVKHLGYDEDVLNSLDITYPVQPAYLQSKIMEYRATHKK